MIFFIFSLNKIRVLRRKKRIFVLVFDLKNKEILLFFKNKKHKKIKIKSNGLLFVLFLLMIMDGALTEKINLSIAIDMKEIKCYFKKIYK